MSLLRFLPRRSPSALVLFGLTAVGSLLLWADRGAAPPVLGGRAMLEAGGVAALALTAISAAMLLSRRAATFRRLFAAHVVVSWLLILLYTRPLDHLLILAVANVVPACLYERLPLGIAFSLAFAAPTAVMAIAQGALGPPNVVALLWTLAIVGVLGSLMSNYREGMIPLQGYINRLEDNVTQLTRANSLSQDYARDIEEESRTAERQRLTRDIHDVVGYTLTNSIMMIEAVRVMARTEPEKIPDYIEVLRRNTEEGLAEIKRILTDLRSREKPEESVYWAVRKMVKVFTLSTGLEVRFEFGNASWEYFDRSADCVYHFVQEGLINAFRHGRAAKVWLFSWDYGREVRLSVKDNGVGCDEAPEEHIGIGGMRERAAAAGGRIAIDDHVNGFSISLYLPRAGEDGRQDQSPDR